MEAVFTLPYSEFRTANRLAELFPKQDGFSLLLPSSRTEKGFDLALLKQNGVKRSVITIQIKTRKGTQDKFFGFGFDEPAGIYQTRGNQNRELKDYSSFLPENRVESILQSLS
jgi:hypothetical protein